MTIEPTRQRRLTSTMFREAAEAGGRSGSAGGERRTPEAHRRSASPPLSVGGHHLRARKLRPCRDLRQICDRNPHRHSRRLGSPVGRSVYASSLQLEGAVCIAISQSGRSPDLLATVVSLKAAGAGCSRSSTTPLRRSPNLADEVLSTSPPVRNAASPRPNRSSRRCRPSRRVIAAWTDDAGAGARELDAAPRSRRSLGLRLVGRWPNGSRSASDLYVLGRGSDFGNRAGSCAQAQGNLAASRRGVQHRRASPRPDGARPARLSRS